MYQVLHTYDITPPERWMFAEESLSNKGTQENRGHHTHTTYLSQTMARTGEPAKDEKGGESGGELRRRRVASSPDTISAGRKEPVVKSDNGPSLNGRHAPSKKKQHYEKRSSSEASFRLMTSALVAGIFVVGNIVGRLTAPKCDQELTSMMRQLTANLSNDAITSRDPDAVISLDGYEPPPYEAVHNHSDFIMSPLRPGELKMLRWNEDWFDGEKFIADNFAARIGLPKHMMAVLRKYAADLGMLDLMHHVHYKEPCEPNTGKFHVTPAVNSGGHKLKWYVQRPGKHYDSDLHWFAGADERTHESFLRALADAGFDELLNAVGEEYDLDGLAFQGVGFLSATHAEDGFIHWDWADSQGKAFNLLIPIEQVPGSGPELYVSDGNDEDDNHGEIKLHPSYGLLLGDMSWHGTHECDHRPTGKVRASVSLYFADITLDNLEHVAGDETAIFPLPGSTKWLYTQRGRHWGGKRSSLVEDIGRRPFRAVDLWDNCTKVKEEGQCEVSNAHTIRTNCPVTCEVYIDDEEYQPGVPRSKLYY